MQFINFLLPLLFAISGVSAQDPNLTSVTTYYTTFTVSRVVETTTCTSTTTPPVISTTEAPVPTSSNSTSSSTQLLTQTVQKIAASPVVPSSMVSVYPVASAASASAGMPYASANGTTVAISSPTIAPYTGAASGLTIQFGAAAVIAAVAGVAQML